jgi:hypothetical protein
VVEGVALALADLFYRFCAGAKFASAKSLMILLQQNLVRVSYLQNH